MRVQPLPMPALLMILCALPALTHAGSARVVYDFVAEYAGAKVNKTLASTTAMFTSGGVEKQSITLHPVGKDDATATYKVQLPAIEKGERLMLVFSAGMGDGFRTDDPKNPSDGVIFKVRVGKDEKFKQDLTAVGWVAGSADLTGRAGKSVDIAFATNAKGNSNYDWAAFGQPEIVRLGGNELSPDGTVLNCAGIVTARAEKDGVTIELTPLSESGSPIGKATTMPLTKDRLSAIPFDFADVRAASVRITAVGGKVKDLGAYGYESGWEIASFGPSRAILFAGEPMEYRCAVRNSGRGLLSSALGAKVQLTLGDTGASAGDESIGAVFPGEEKSFTWKNVSLPTGDQVSATVTITSQGVLQVSDTVVTQVSGRPGAIPVPKAAECITLPDGSVILQNTAVRMTFLKSGGRFTGWTLSVPNGEKWEQVASGSPLGKVVTPRATNPCGREQILYPTELKSDSASGKPVAGFSLADKAGDVPCRFEWTFTLDPIQPKISVSHSMTADQRVEVLHFAGPMVYAGDGAFGGKKDEALFPGLEYLLTESSSGTENVSPPNHLRTVPHPNKVTVPFMAVRSGRTLVSLEWDPLQKWDGAANRPATVFASPNFLDGQDNHKMGLILPSVPEWMPENKQIASKSYMLGAGKSLSASADIVVKADSSTIIDAVDGWIARHAIPETKPIARNVGGVMTLCDKAYLETIWDPQAKGWKHTNTSAPTFDSQIATYLLRKASFVMDPQRKKSYSDVVQAAIGAVGKDNLGFDAALLAGGVQSALKRMGDRAKGLMASQREDGSWPFKPDEKHSVLGKTDDTSSGYSANSAMSLLEYALIADDKAATEAGLKALRYLDTQTRPEGAQTWELQLHVPDILGSSRLVRAYTYAYQLTDDKKYLDRAVYWAKTGLPFVYLWSASDRPIMLYGTIPVFGATWFTGQPWFGVDVQWCGMDYAYSLIRLSDFDKTLPWDKIAEGIFYSGAQQQELITQNYPNEAGLYPDAYSPIKGDEQYHWSLNPGLLSKGMVRLANSDCYPYTHTVKDLKGNRLTVTIPVQGAEFHREPDFIVGSFRYTFGATVHIVIGGVYFPESVTLNGLGIRRVEDVEMAEEGWQYIPETNLTIIKMKTRSQNSIGVDMLPHETRLEEGKELEKQ